MKPPPFSYVRPTTVDEVVELLGDDEVESKVLAGGQSLVPMLNFRLARPDRLVDIASVPDLAGIELDDQIVRIGARTRHVDLEHATVPGPLGRLLADTASLIGHAPIRTRGTFGGSLCHGDTVAEWCLLARCLDATMHVVGPTGDRSIPAADFFQTVFTTAVDESELLTHVTIPHLDDDHLVGIAEFARRAGDFAIVAAMVDLDVANDEVMAARVCLGGVSDVPQRSPAAEAALLGQPVTSTSLRRAGEAAAEEVSPPEDLHGDADYRRDLVRALVPRTLFGDREDDQ